MVEEFGRGERLAGVVRAGGINRDGRALGGVELGAHLVVQPAEHRAVPHPEVIALGQWDRASGAREATHVEHQVSGPHHQLRGEDRRVAAGASLHAAEHPAKKKEHGSERKENPRRRGDPFEPRPIEWQLQLTTIVKIEMAMIGETTPFAPSSVSPLRERRDQLRRNRATSVQKRIRSKSRTSHNKNNQEIIVTAGCSRRPFFHSVLNDTNTSAMGNVSPSSPPYPDTRPCPRVDRVPLNRTD